MHEPEMGDVQETFQPAAGERGYVDAGTVDLLESLVVPVGHGRDHGVGVRGRSQAGPHQPVPLDDGEGPQIQPGRDLRLGMRRHLHASPAVTEAQPVVRAGDAGAVARAEAQRDAPVRADVVGHDHAAVRSVGDQGLVEQTYGDGGVADLARSGDRVPVPGEIRPVVGVERAVTGQEGPGRCSGHAEVLPRSAAETARQAPVRRARQGDGVGEVRGEMRAATSLVPGERRRRTTAPGRSPAAVIGTRSGVRALGRRM